MPPIPFENAVFFLRFFFCENKREFVCLISRDWLPFFVLVITSVPVEDSRRSSGARDWPGRPIRFVGFAFRASRRLGRQGTNQDPMKVECQSEDSRTEKRSVDRIWVSTENGTTNGSVYRALIGSFTPSDKKKRYIQPINELLRQFVHCLCKTKTISICQVWARIWSHILV